jgi:hypothetical protein
VPSCRVVLHSMCLVPPTWWFSVYSTSLSRHHFAAMIQVESSGFSIHFPPQLDDYGSVHFRVSPNISLVCIFDRRTLGLACDTVMQSLKMVKLRVKRTIVKQDPTIEHEDNALRLNFVHFYRCPTYSGRNFSCCISNRTSECDNLSNWCTPHK